jgi:hypothetical protein
MIAGAVIPRAIQLSLATAVMKERLHSPRHIQNGSPHAVCYGRNVLNVIRSHSSSNGGK